MERQQYSHSSHLNGRSPLWEGSSSRTRHTWMGVRRYVKAAILALVTLVWAFTAVCWSPLEGLDSNLWPSKSRSRSWATTSRNTPLDGFFVACKMMQNYNLSQTVFHWSINEANTNAHTYTHSDTHNPTIAICGMQSVAFCLKTLPPPFSTTSQQLRHPPISFKKHQDRLITTRRAFNSWDQVFLTSRISVKLSAAEKVLVRSTRSYGLLQRC